MESEATVIVLKELAGNPPPRLNALQALLEPHVGLLTDFWIAAWAITGAVVLWRLWYEYRARKSTHRP